MDGSATMWLSHYIDLAHGLQHHALNKLIIKLIRFKGIWNHSSERVYYQGSYIIYDLYANGSEIFKVFKPLAPNSRGQTPFGQSPDIMAFHTIPVSNLWTFLSELILSIQVTTLQATR